MKTTVVHGVGISTKGPHKRYGANGKHTAAYRTWDHMLARCYAPLSEVDRDAYIDIHVCDAWLEFQVFATWYNNHFWAETDFQIDKDWTVLGNKLYCPDACDLIPREINNAAIKRHDKVGDYPTGVTLNQGQYLAHVSMFGKQITLGRFSTPDAAFACYKQAKEDYLGQLAYMNKEYISAAVYHNLTNYEVTPC